MDEEMMQGQAAPEQEGRATDTVVGHLTQGEIVVPIDLQQDPQIMQLLQQAFGQAGINIAEFTVGDPANKINPETGYPEFFSLGHILKSISGAILPQLGIIGGAANGLIQGNGLSGALKGGLQGGINAITSIAGQSLLPGIGSSLGSIFGDAAGTPLSGGLQGPTLGSGINGAFNTAGRSLGIGGSIGGLTGAASGGGSTFNLGSSLASAIGGANQDAAIKKAQKQLLASNAAQQANIGTFDPSNITNDAGYQFNLAQGQQGLDRQLAAGGNYFSGDAAKAAVKYNQDYADNALNSAYGRYTDTTSAKNQLLANQGAINSQGTIAGANNLASSLSGVLNPTTGISQNDLLKQLLSKQQGTSLYG